MSTDDVTYEGGDGLTQEMALAFVAEPLDTDLQGRALSDADHIHRLGPNYRYIRDESNPEGAFITHVRHTEPPRPGNEDIPFPVLIRVGTLGRILDAKAEEMRNRPLETTPLFNRLLAEIKAISPAGEYSGSPPGTPASPQVDIGQLQRASAPPGTPMGQGGKRQ